jgi:putative glutamine amidotransferase
MAVPVIGVTGRIEQSVRLPSKPIISMSRSYVRAVAIAGGAPVVTVPHADEEALRAVFERLDGLLLSGGGDVLPAFYGEDDSGLLWAVDQQRDRTELTLARWALSEGLPLLAICRGTQVLNVAAGGTLIQDIATGVPGSLTHSTVAVHPPSGVAHAVQLAEGSRLSRLFGTGEIGVNSAHHQAVKDLGAGLIVAARAPDGVVEGIEAPDHPFCIGVQWHPETMLETQPHMLRLFEALVERASAEPG